MATMFSPEDESFAAWTAHTAALIARGDLAAFEIPGDVEVTPQGQARFTQTLLAIAQAVRAHQKPVPIPAIVRWRFDMPGSEAAQQRTAPNVLKLMPAIQAAAVALQHAGLSLQALVTIEFVNMGQVPPHIGAALQQLGVSAHFLEALGPGAVATDTGTTLWAWDTSNPDAIWLGKYQIGAQGAQLIKHESMHPARSQERRTEFERAGQRMGTTVGGFAIWAFGETGEIWTKHAFPASGPRSDWRIGRTRLDGTAAAAVVSFLGSEDLGHRGVKLRLCSGRELMMVEERDTTPQQDPTYNLDNALFDGAWAGALARDVALWLGIPHLDERT